MMTGLAMVKESERPKGQRAKSMWQHVAVGENHALDDWKRVNLGWFEGR